LDLFYEKSPNASFPMPETGFAEGMPLFYGMGSPEFTNHIPVKLTTSDNNKTFRDQQTTSDLVEDFL
jgi:hypothetical protein